MKIKTLLITALLITPSLLLAQRGLGDVRFIKISSSYDVSDKSIKGTPYIIEDFMPAKISANDDKIYSVRYNANIDEMEVELADKSISAVNINLSDLRITFLKGEKIYQSINYLNEKGSFQKGYFVHVNNPDSKIKLLIKESKNFIPRKTPDSGYDKIKPAHFSKQKDTYYIILKNKTAQIFPKKRKDILKLFPENSTKIASFMKSKKIKTSRQDDLINLMNYINSL